MKRRRELRQYGGGSVTQRPSGTWLARYRAAGVVVPRSFATKDAADAWLRQSKPQKAYLDAYGLPDRGEKPDATFKEAAELLPAAWAARGRTADSIRGYRSHLAAALRDWGPRRIADTRPAALLAWTAAQQRAGLANRTLRQRLTLLSQTMKAAVDAGWITAVPCAVPRPRVVAKSERSCTPEPQFEKLLKAAQKSEDPRHLALLLLAADAGLRRGELARVLGRHVQLGGDGRTNWGSIHVAVLSEAARTKSGKGRTVPVLTERLAAALKATFPGADKPLLRTSTQGVRLLAEELWALAGLGPGSRLHELRHRWVTKLLDGGEAPVTVQAWAGHADLVTTMGYHHGAAAPSERASLALLGAPQEKPTRPPGKAAKRAPGSTGKHWDDRDGVRS